MNDNTSTPSGSRWEPGDDGQAPEVTAAEMPAEPDVPPAAPLDDPAGEERRAQLRGRAILAGAATALALGGGLTGFVIGHSTAGNGSADLRPANFSNQGPGGPPTFRSGDGNDDGFGPPQGFDGGPSSSDSGTTGSST